MESLRFAGLASSFATIWNNWQWGSTGNPFANSDEGGISQEAIAEAVRVAGEALRKHPDELVTEPAGYCGRAATQAGAGTLLGVSRR